MFLQASHLSLRYPGQSHAAVVDVSFQLKAGEIGVLIGPSGCGKTTLLRAVAGLERCSGGQLSLGGELVSDERIHQPVEKRRIGMVFQDYALFPHLSVNGNIAFGLTQLPPDQRAKRVAEVLTLVGLEGHGERYPHALSGGQQQRVALARALAPKPRLLLLDEPFSNLDVELRERLAHEVRGIIKTEGTTALFVTHDQLEAFAIGDVIGVMRSGELHQWADASTLYEQPATRFVAEFIGHGALVPAQLSTDAATGIWSAETVLGRLQAPSSGESLTDASSVLLRADEIFYDPESPIRALVKRKAFRGSSALYTLQLTPDITVLGLLPARLGYQVGDQMGIRPRVERLITFSDES